jgi:hypothetical protein
MDKRVNLLSYEMYDCTKTAMEDQNYRNDICPTASDETKVKAENKVQYGGVPMLHQSIITRDHT